MLTGGQHWCSVQIAQGPLFPTLCPALLCCGPAWTTSTCWLFSGRPLPTHTTPAPTDPQSSFSSPPPRSLGTRHSEAREKALDRAPDGGATLEQGSAPGCLGEVRGGPGNHLLL